MRKQCEKSGFNYNLAYAGALVDLYISLTSYENYTRQNDENGRLMVFIFISDRSGQSAV